MDVFSFWGLALVVAVVSAACLAIYKLLSRETTFDEVYGSNTIKLLARQQEAEKNKPKLKRIHSKWKQNLKKDGNSKKHDHIDEIKNDDVSYMKTFVEMQEVEETEPKLKDEFVKLDQQSDSVVKVEEEGPDVNVKRSKKQASRLNTTENPNAPKLKEDSNNVVMDEMDNKRESLSLQNEHSEKMMNTESNVSDASEYENRKDSLISQSHLHQQIQIKSKNSEVTCDVSFIEVLGRLKKMEENESQYIDSLQKKDEEAREKENLHQKRIKEIEDSLKESRKKCFNSKEEIEILKSENAKLINENKENAERHVVFEQTVRNKLVETHQLKDANKQLLESINQLRTEIAKHEQFRQQLLSQQADFTKLREERDLAVKEVLVLREDLQRANKYVDNAAIEVRSKEALLANMENNFAHQNQAVQNEIAKEHLQYEKVKQDWLDAKSMVEQMARELASTKDLLRNSEIERECKLDLVKKQADQFKKEKDQAIQLNKIMKAEYEAVQNECKRLLEEGDTLNLELKSLRAHMTITQASSTELIQLKNEITQLNLCLNDKRARNQELRDANYKLMDTIKLMKSGTIVNGTASNSYVSANEENGHFLAQNEEVSAEDKIEQLITENKQFKLTLDVLLRQLEEVSQIAKEMEIEKNAKIAQIENKLKNLLKSMKQS